MDKTCYEIWQLFFTESLLEYVTTQTILYAKRDRNDASFNVTANEMKQFIGILLFSGYHFVTSERDYWSNQPDLKVPFIAESMSRDKFLKIK